MKTPKSALESFELKFFKKLKNLYFWPFLGPTSNFSYPHAVFAYWQFWPAACLTDLQKWPNRENWKYFFSEIKNMDHKLSNDVSNVFRRHLVQILSHFKIFSKHVILTRKREGVIKKTSRFQNPVLECSYDLWLWFYASLGV